MKHAIVNGQEISGEAVQFELDRLVRFYMGHGMTMEEIKTNLPKLEEKALEQAIGAKLLLDRAQEIDVPVTGTSSSDARSRRSFAPTACSSALSSSCGRFCLISSIDIPWPM